ncbi:hypothetical protein JTB14_011331 [Gonioctena quinquepunctata]|nr:hypothetical protein JTB14_011331 [Gonioctena quinquepunctata]
MLDVTREMKKIINNKDFETEIGDDCKTNEYETILFHIRDQKLRDRIRELEAIYRTNKLYDVFHEYYVTIQEDEYTPLKSEKETVIDYFITKNEEAVKKGTAQTPPKTQSTDEEAPPKKSPFLIAYENDLKAFKEREAAEQRNEKSTDAGRKDRTSQKQKSWKPQPKNTSNTCR